MTKSELIKIATTTKEKVKDVYEWAKEIRDDILLKCDALMRMNEVIDDVFYELDWLKEELEVMDYQETQEG